MKIDIHVHTKKTKTGDSENRNIDVEKFSEIIRSTDVKILAITNHNHFDKEQYNLFKEKVNGHCQIWPGIELDILESGRRGHLIVIVNPKNSIEFYKIIEELLQNSNEDNFTISINETVNRFDSLDAIYIPHYFAKKPNLTDDEVNSLMGLVSNDNRVLKEATNAISAGIYVNHGHKSIYGSDVQNWNDYINLAPNLPDLRLPVESYEQFCLLLEKDDSTINTLLDKKTKENIVVNPFGPSELVELDIYNDINILFGSKGTGKSEILFALSQYYNAKGYKTEVYESNALHLDTVYDLKSADYENSIDSDKFDNCIEEIKFIKCVTEKNVSSISNYYRYFSAEETNKISKSLKIKNYTQLDQNSSKRKFEEVTSTLNQIKKLEKYIENSSTLKNVLKSELYDEFRTITLNIISELKAETEGRLIDYKSLSLFNNIIEIFVGEISKKTGLPEKPIKTGFYDYASNRIDIERNINKIVDNITKEINPVDTYVGDLGEKGKLHCQTNFIIQNGDITNSKYIPIRKVNKMPQKEVAKQLKTIKKYIYTNELFEKISSLNSIDGSETINSVSDLLLFYKHFTLNNKLYRPSNGESSMILLHNELRKDREIFLIDEPEKSLGNDYINDVIVPLLKEHAQRGRKVIIATHDANIAVRTLPYNSIYREHDLNGYNTYSGNPFSNNLICLNKEKEGLDWKLISMKTLEGGKEAFGERGKIYGNL